MATTRRPTSEDKKILCSSGWLSTRSVAFREAFLELGFLKTLEVGQVLYQRDEVTGHMHGLIQGQIDVHVLSETGEESVFPFGRPGRWFGVGDVISQEPAAGQTIARRPSRLLSVSRSELMRFLDADPRRWIDVVAYLNMVRRQMQRLMVETFGASGTERIVKRLAWLLEAGRLDRDNSLRISQNDFATSIGLSLPTVQRTLRELKGSGIIETRYGRIIVKDAQKLKALMETKSIS